MSTIVLALRYETFSISGIKDGQVTFIRDARGREETPACVYLRSDGAHTVGYQNDWKTCDEEIQVKNICSRKHLLMETPIRVAGQEYGGRELADIFVEYVLNQATKVLGEVRTVALLLPGTYGREIYVLTQAIQRWGKSVRVFKAEDVIAYSSATQNEKLPDKFAVCYMGHNALELGTYEKDYNSVSSIGIQQLKVDYLDAYQERIMSKTLSKIFDYGYLPTTDQYPKAYRIAETESEGVLGAKPGADYTIPANFLLPFRVEGGITFTNRELRALAEEYSDFEFEPSEHSKNMLLVQEGNYPVMYEKLYETLQNQGINIIEWDINYAIPGLLRYLSEENGMGLESSLTEDLLLMMDGGKKRLLFPSGTKYPTATEFAVLTRAKEKIRCAILSGSDVLLWMNYEPKADEMVQIQVRLLPSGLIEATAYTEGGHIAFTADTMPPEIKEAYRLPCSTEVITT